MGIAPQRFLDLKCQRVHPLAHVGPADRQPHPYARRDRDHRRSRRSSTRRSALPSTPLPTRTRYPASSISIVSAPRDLGDASSPCAAVIVTGTSDGPVGLAGASTPPR